MVRRRRLVLRRPGGHQAPEGLLQPWAIQYYTVLYSVFAAKSDPARAALYRDRATKFGQQFARWFDENGAALPLAAA